MRLFLNGMAELFVMDAKGGNFLRHSVVYNSNKYLFGMPINFLTFFQEHSGGGNKCKWPLLWEYCKDAYPEHRKDK